VDLVNPLDRSPAFLNTRNQAIIRVIVGLIRNRDEDAARAAAPQDGGRDGVRRVPPPPAQAVH
jgi:hypothetical protein